MPTLHVVRQSAFNTDDFAQCVKVLRNDDIIVFIDDGCYNLHHQLVTNIDSNANIHLNVIESHALARGISIDNSLYNGIDMKALVELTLTTNRVITWQ